MKKEVIFLKRFIVLISTFALLVILTIICFYKENNDKESKLIKLKVAEVTHSVFYAPWYVALHNGYLSDFDIELVLTSGANNVAAAVLSGDAEIGLCGPEATIYVYKDNKDDYLQTFAGLTKRDGQFLVLRKGVKYDSFEDLNGLTILAGRSGGMPLINFTNALKLEGLHNVNIDTSIEFANLSAAFIAGTGDGVNLFDDRSTIITFKKRFKL